MLGRCCFAICIVLGAGQSASCLSHDEVSGSVLLQKGSTREPRASVLSGESLTQRPCGILWHYHIGKCAGTSILAWLIEMKKIGLLHDVFELVDYNQPVNFDSFHQQHLQPFISNPAGRLVAIHHHHGGPGLYGMQPYFQEVQSKLHAQGCSLVRFTLVREPMSKLASMMNYAMRWHPASQSEDPAEHHKFAREILMADVDFDNPQVRYTLNNWREVPQRFPMEIGDVNESALNAAIQMLDSFEVVGLVEQLHVSIAEVKKLLGLHSAQGVPRENTKENPFVNGSGYGIDGAKLPADVVALMHERVVLDNRLHTRYAARGLR